MAKIALVDFDGRIPNLALMRLSAYHKGVGDEVVLNKIPQGTDKVYVSVIFEKNRKDAELLAEQHPNVVIGGTGYDLSVALPEEIERTRPDYELYTVEEIYRRICRGVGKKESKIEKARILVEAGIGFTTRGCIRTCGFCVVPKKEGDLHQVAEIKDILNPKSNVLVLLDNNFTADPLCLDKLREIKERKLVVDIAQGIDVRVVTPEISKALSEVRHLRSIHMAWDQIGQERMVLDGIRLLSQFVNPRKLMCFMLTGWKSTFEEDTHRFRRLLEHEVDPFVMVYNRSSDLRLKHYARWVNGRFYKAVPNFDDYDPWRKVRDAYLAGAQFSLACA